MKKKTFLLNLFNKFKLRKKIYLDGKLNFRYNKWLTSLLCKDYFNRLTVVAENTDKVLGVNLVGSFYALEFSKRKEFKQFLYDYPQIEINGILYATSRLEEKVILKGFTFTAFSFGHILIKLEPL